LFDPHPQFFFEPPILLPEAQLMNAMVTIISKKINNGFLFIKSSLVN